MTKFSTTIFTLYIVLILSLSVNTRSHGRKKISFSVPASDSKVPVVAKDNGEGIRFSVYQKLFDLFKYLLSPLKKKENMGNFITGFNSKINIFIETPSCKNDTSAIWDSVNSLSTLIPGIRKFIDSFNKKKALPFFMLNELVRFDEDVPKPSDNEPFYTRCINYDNFGPVDIAIVKFCIFPEIVSKKIYKGYFTFGIEIAKLAFDAKSADFLESGKDLA